MYVSLRDPQFVIHRKIEQGDEAFVIWDYQLCIKKYKPDVTQIIRSNLHLKFDLHNRMGRCREALCKAAGGWRIGRFLKRHMG